MKQSAYNVFVQAKGAVLGFNTFRNQYLALSHEAYRALRTFETQGDSKELSERYPNIWTQLQHLGFIVEDDFDELALLRLSNKQECFASRHYHLMVYPTQDCNLCCWYCYENHVPNTRMSAEVCDSIVAYVQNLVEQNAFDSFRLSFFGGEPLLDFESIAYPLAQKIKQLVEDANKPFTSFFVTNGSLIDESIVDCLRKINPRLQITLDGNRDKHNQVRKWKMKGKPTYDKIIGALHALAKCDEIVPLGITLRINYDNKTLEKLPEILEDLEGIDKRKLCLHFERVWQTADCVDSSQRSRLLEVMRLFLANGYMVDHGVFRPKACSCPAETYSYAIVNYDGSVHKCNGRTLSANTTLGTLHNGSITWNVPKLAKRIGLATFENPDCLACKMLPLCMGPCSQKLEEHGGFDPSICSMHSIDTSLEEYIALDFQTKRLIDHYKNAKL